jgi:iron(III) transport system substrate-binding protein
MRSRLFLVTLLLAVIAAGCSGGRDALTIYSGREESLVGPLLEQFAEETGIDIDVRYGDSVDLALLIAEEGSNTPADVFFSQSPGTVGFLDSQAMLAELESEALDSVDSQFEADDGKWVGVTARQRVLVYNTEVVDPDDLPDSVLELTDEQFAGKVALAPTNASFQDFVTAMRQEIGDDAARSWLEGMVANDSPTYADNSSIVDAVGRGEVPMGLVNHYYNHRALAENPDQPSSNYVFPGRDIGALLIASTVSVIEGTDRGEDAARFVEFLLSREAQEYFSEETFEYPLASGVAPAGDLEPLDAVDAPDVDIGAFGSDLRSTAQMIAESGLL